MATHGVVDDLELCQCEMSRNQAEEHKDPFRPINIRLQGLIRLAEDI